MVSDPAELDDKIVEYARAELERIAPSPRGRIFEKFLLAALSSIPWVGSFVAAAASIKLEDSQLRTERLQRMWLEEHQRKMDNLRVAVADVLERLDGLGEDIEDRVQSEGYLSLVRSAFRAWDRAETDEKRKYIANLIANAAGTRLCSDDVVRLFVEWLDKYHEPHFAVIREIYQRSGSTRLAIGRALYGQLPREDSAEADLFRLLVFELNTGRVIRQARATTPEGQFVRERPPGPRAPRSNVVESSFEDEKPYVLTELGKQFVHYVMNEVVPRISGGRGV